MGKELRFPTKTVRDWRLIEAAIADVLGDAQANDQMTAQVTAHMKEHFTVLNRQASIDMSLPFPGSTSVAEREAIVVAIQVGINKLESEMQAQTNLALLQLLATEVRLYIAEYGDPSIPDDSPVLPQQQGVGGWRLADEFVEAGDKLKSPFQTSGSILPPAPLYLLYCHGIEVAIKAFLVSQGITDKALRKLGHNLLRAVTAAQKHPSFASISESDLAILEWVNSYYKGKEFEYLFTGYKSYPQPKVLGDLARRLLAELKPIIDSAVRKHTAPIKDKS